MSTYSLTKSKVSQTYYRVLQITDDNTVLDGLGVTVSISEDNLQGIYTSYSVLRSDVDILITGGTQSSGGFTGPQGWQGFQGLVGFTGIQGNWGWQGFQGLTGIGETGATGSQGFQGIIGLTGVQGSQGWQGLEGLTGITGSIGPQGFVGFQGLVGDQGPQGLTGNSGGWSIDYVLEGGDAFVDGKLEMEGSDIPTTTKIRASYLDINGNNILNLLTLWDENFSNSPTIVLKIYDMSDSLFYHYFSTRGGDLRMSGEGLEISNTTYLDGCVDDVFGLRTIGLSLVVQGDIGPVGLQGSNGSTGLQGRQGPQPDAVAGPQGFQGNQGLIGSQGFQGRQGIQGVQGSGSSSSSTNTLIMIQSYTSSSSSDTVVTGLTFSTEPGSRYMVNVIGLFRSNNASGNPSFGLDAGSGATISGWLRRGTTTNPTSNQGYLLNGVPLAGAATMTANTDFPFLMEASVVTPNFGGTLSVIVSSTSPHILTVHPNSLMNIVKVG